MGIHLNIYVCPWNINFLSVLLFFTASTAFENCGFTWFRYEYAHVYTPQRNKCKRAAHEKNFSDEGRLSKVQPK